MLNNSFLGQISMSDPLFFMTIMCPFPNAEVLALRKRRTTVTAVVGSSFRVQSCFVRFVLRLREKTCCSYNYKDELYLENSIIVLSYLNGVL